jgi:hypothetical protein
VLIRTLAIAVPTLLQVFEGGSVSYAYTTIPTYPSGQIGMMVCCKGQQLDMRQPRQQAPGAHEQLGIGPLRWVLHAVARVGWQLGIDQLRQQAPGPQKQLGIGPLR